MPSASTRIVPRELEAVLTVAPDEPVVWAELVVELVVLLELLPHAASTRETPSAGTNTFSRSRMVISDLARARARASLLLLRLKRLRGARFLPTQRADTGTRKRARRAWPRIGARRQALPPPRRLLSRPNARSPAVRARARFS